MKTKINQIKYLKARVKILEKLYLEEAIKCQSLSEELSLTATK